MTSLRHRIGGIERQTKDHLPEFDRVGLDG